MPVFFSIVNTFSVGFPDLVGDLVCGIMVFALVLVCSGKGLLLCWLGRLILVWKEVLALSAPMLGSKALSKKLSLLSKLAPSRINLVCKTYSGTGRFPTKFYVHCMS